MHACPATLWNLDLCLYFITNMMSVLITVNCYKWNAYTITRHYDDCLDTAQLLGGKSCSRRTLPDLSISQTNPMTKHTKDSM